MFAGYQLSQQDLGRFAGVGLPLPFSRSRVAQKAPDLFCGVVSHLACKRITVPENLGATKKNRSGCSYLHAVNSTYEVKVGTIFEIWYGSSLASNCILCQGQGW